MMVLKQHFYDVLGNTRFRAMTSQQSDWSVAMTCFFFISECHYTGGGLLLDYDQEPIMYIQPYFSAADKDIQWDQ